MKDGPQTQWSTTRLGSTPDLSGTCMVPLNATAAAAQLKHTAGRRSIRKPAHSTSASTTMSQHHQYALHSKLRQKSTLENASCKPRPRAQSGAAICRSKRRWCRWWLAGSADKGKGSAGRRTMDRVVATFFDPSASPPMVHSMSFRSFCLGRRPKAVASEFGV